MAMRKPKRPKAPKRSASVAVWERYEKRLKEWKQKLAKMEADKRRKEAIIQRVRKLASAY